MAIKSTVNEMPNLPAMYTTLTALLVLLI